MQKKARDKIQHTLIVIKTLKKLGIEGLYLNIIKATYDKLIANPILNREKLNTSYFRLGTRQGFPLSPTSI
jgi:hypothetical protein